MTATITVHGGLTSAPELRYSQNGLAIVSGTVASTDRFLDRQTNEWKDGKKLYLRFTAFKDLAEHIAASGLDKGAQVVVTGKLHTREYTDRDQNPRTSTELELIDFAVSLKRATATVVHVQSAQHGQGAGTAPVAGAEPWATPAGAQNAAQPDPWSGGGSFGDDTPF